MRTHGPGGSMATTRHHAARLLLVAALLAGTALGGCSRAMPFSRTHLAPGDPRPARAARTLEEARAVAALHPQDADGLYRLAQWQLAADSLGPAERTLEEALERDSCHAPALALLSKRWFESGRHAEAVRRLEPLRSGAGAFTAEERRVLLAGLALHYDALGRPDLAFAALGAETPGDLASERSVRVCLLLRGERPDSALRPAREALELGPASAVHRNNYGITRLKAGDVEGARRAFLGAIERDPALPGPYYNLAILERFYRLDETASSRWLGEYRKRSQEDPDGLLGAPEAARKKALAEKGD